MREGVYVRLINWHAMNIKQGDLLIYKDKRWSLLNTRTQRLYPLIERMQYLCASIDEVPLLYKLIQDI